MAGFAELKKDIKHRMETTLDVVKKDFAGLRTGRATVSLLDPIMVDAYGSQMPLNQVASVAAPEARMLTVQVWDKGQAKAVEKAIRESNLGLNPAVDGQLLRVPIPPLNEERREELKKVAGKYAEEGKIAIRNVRRDGNDQLKKMEKDGDISEDEGHQYHDEIQKMTDSLIKQIDDVLGQKQEEIMQV
ncbi:MAG: ribosome recycling factor [Alphaproteobacteria bacterium]|nr:ribosome recycling factor [Alphaproteobacteria bacterium]